MTKANGIAMIQELLAASQANGREAEPEEGRNWGTLILDATCVHDDISYPVNLRMLNEAGEMPEKIIDE